jgi:type VI protein secretion system component Hcp
MAPVYFLKLEDIEGESRDPEHSGEIELESFNWSESAGPPPGPQALSFTTRSSKASPSLFVACARGERIASAVLTLRDEGSARRWWFSDVLVAGYATAGGPEEPLDAVSLEAARVEALPTRALRFELIRPDDLLNLEVEAVNLRIDDDDPTEQALVVDDPAQPARLVVTLPPQSIAETAYFEALLVKIDPDPSGRPVHSDPATGKSKSDPLDAPGIAGKRDSVAQLAGRSRLAFDVPPEARVPLSVEGLLKWSLLTPRVSPIAAISPKPTQAEIAAAPSIQPPAPFETALELPYHLVISPNGEVAWRHRSRPFTSRGRTELWHTRLALDTPRGAIELSSEHRAPLRAIWSPDYNPTDPPKPTELDAHLGLAAISPNDRYQLVILTSAFHGWETNPELDDAGLNLQLFPSFGAASSFFDSVRVRFPLPRPYVPAPFEAEQLMLSPLGGWLRSRGNWDPPRRVPHRFHLRPDLDRIFGVALHQRDPARSPLATSLDLANPALISPKEDDVEKLDLSEWVHVAAQGRDHYVKIVYEGRLKPHKHRASLVKVTERKFVEEGDIVVAYLKQRMYVVVRQFVRDFDDRGMPFRSVRLTTRVTPDIAKPSYIHKELGGRSFWVEVETADQPTPRRFTFHAVGIDQAGNEVDMTIPMIFASVGDNEAARKAVVDEYNASPNSGALAARDALIPGQKVAFAPSDGDPTKRNTELVTESLNFVIDPQSDEPKLLKAEVRIPQVEELLGTSSPTTIRLSDAYIKDGVGGATGVFAEIAQPDFGKFTSADPLGGMQPATLGVEFRSEKAGGFATPDLGVSTLSRAHGPLGGTVADALTGTFSPASFFSKASARLFGSLRLADLLLGGGLDGNAPTMITKTSQIPEGRLVVTTLDWVPSPKIASSGPVTFTPKAGTEFEVHGTITRWPKPDDPSAPPAFQFSGNLTNFHIDILGSVIVNFAEFSFVSVSKQKPDVTIVLEPSMPVQFHGDLEFVEQLREIIPPGLFGDGPSLDITPAGIHVGFGVGLPPVAVGVFSLKDVQLAAGLTLPLVDGKPVLDFSFSSREHPFLLAVAIFGGGGFFHLQLDTAGMKELEAALEFGATASLDIGVASGSVHMMAGIYFSLQRKDPSNELDATLAGYLRIGGSLSVLALITVSVEFNLTFVYSEEGKAYGRATLTVQVEVAFFSKSVELTVERTFAGQSGDPKFAELFTTPATWSEYALAFARKEG